MHERRVQCEFFVPIVRNSDQKPHQPVAWSLLVNEIRRLFPAGHTGPETFYRGDSLVPGEYEGTPETQPIKDISRRYILAIPDAKVSDLRLLLRMAAHTFDQLAIYLAVAGHGQRISITVECKDFRQKAGAEGASLHLAADAVVEWVTLE